MFAANTRFHSHLLRLSLSHHARTKSFHAFFFPLRVQANEPVRVFPAAISLTLIPLPLLSHRRAPSCTFRQGKTYLIKRQRKFTHRELPVDFDSRFPLSVPPSQQVAMQNPSLQDLSQEDAPSTEPSLQQLRSHLRQLNMVAFRHYGTELPQVEKDRLLQLEQVIGRRQVFEEFPMGDKHQSTIALKERDEVILQNHDAIKEEFDILKNEIVQMQENTAELKKDNDNFKKDNAELQKKMIDTKNANRFTLSAEVVPLTKVNAELKEQIAKLQNYIAELNKNNNELYKDNDKLNKNKDKLNKGAAELKTAQNNLKHAQNILNSERVMRKQKKATLKEKIAKLKNANEDLYKEITEVIEKVEEVSERNRVLEKALAAGKKVFDSI
jgi:chromosome segregation ATPase